MPETGQVVSIILWGLGLIATIIYAVSVCKKEKVSYPIFVTLGSLISIPYEAFNNTLGHCLHPQIGQISIVHVFDRPIPLWTMFAFALYFATPTIYFIEQIRKGKMTSKRWWGVYGFLIAFALIVEFIFVKIGIWSYYGDNQPMKVLGVPIWWGFVNASSILSVTLIVYLLDKYLLKNNYTWLLLPLYPMIVWTAHGGPSFPAFATVSTSQSMTVTTIGSLLSILLSFLVVWLGARIIKIVKDNY